MKLFFYRVCRAYRALAFTALAFIAVALVVPMFVQPAFAMTPSCQAEMDNITKVRQAAVDRVNSFAKKKPTATQACAAFSSLAKEDGKLLGWMTANKDWCQVPDQFIEQVTQAREQATKVRDQACSAAKQEAQMRRNAAPTGAPPPGAGVRLPQGAL